jgi:hypothetical protein
MPVISDTLLLVTLSSGARALYSVQPQHMNRQHYGATLNQSAIEYGTQIAVQCNGQWYKPGLREPITDHRTIALIERSPEA